jgi:formiminotetrahydrofolate cyclodeaminase
MADATLARDVHPGLAGLTLEDFAARLASAEPVPGGGSASAVAAALAASLVEMVARLSRDRPKYADYATTHERAAARAEELRRRFLELAQRDADAYSNLSEAMRLPRSSDGEAAVRNERIRAAARRATEVPLEVVRSAHDLAGEIECLAGRSNRNASSDLVVAALLAEAAAGGAGQNVLVNLPSVADGEWAGATTLELHEHLEAVQHLARVTREVVGGGNLRDPEES